MLALLGQLLGVPERIRELSLFGHVPDVAAPEPGVIGLGVLLAVAAVAGALGVVAMGRRDLTTI